jgi:inhibitor of KinA
MKLEPLGDSAVVATLGSGIDEATLGAVLAFSEAIVAAGRPGVTDVVPAYDTVTVFYDPASFASGSDDAFDAVCRFMESCSVTPHTEARAREAKRVEIPVCYGNDFAPDLGAVAALCGKSAWEVIALHSGADYLVHAIGFTPGFAYLGGLPEVLRTPRRGTPRAHVPAGSVGIGGSQTGVYPVNSPGGWQIIGRTPLALFRPKEKPVALLGLGDRVRFIPITREAFELWK